MPSNYKKKNKFCNKAQKSEEFINTFWENPKCSFERNNLNILEVPMKNAVFVILNEFR